MKIRKILGVPIHIVDLDELREILTKFFNSQRGEFLNKGEVDCCHIVTVNPEIILWAQKDASFKQVLEQASLNLVDGSGLQWAANYLEVVKETKERWLRFYLAAKTLLLFLFRPKTSSKIVIERITGIDLIYQLSALAQTYNKSIFLLGGSGETANEAAQQLRQSYPQLQISGAERGPWFSLTELEDQELMTGWLEKINQAGPDILFVAFGHPKQEYWLNRFLSQLSSVKIAVGVGGAFDIIAGRLTRAPRVLQDFHLEWFWRLLLEPRRLPRIFNATVKFILKVVKDSIKH